MQCMVVGRCAQHALLTQLSSVNVYLSILVTFHQPFLITNIRILQFWFPYVCPFITGINQGLPALLLEMNVAEDVPDGKNWYWNHYEYDCEHHYRCSPLWVINSIKLRVLGLHEFTSNDKYQGQWRAYCPAEFPYHGRLESNHFLNVLTDIFNSIDPCKGNNLKQCNQKQWQAHNMTFKQVQPELSSLCCSWKSK